MAQVVKTLQIFELDDGSVRVISTDKRQMARWYGLDYLTDKPQLTNQGYYHADVSCDFYFAPTFRKKNK